ncbi:MAG: carbon-nitrogen hydrolase family protein, partial [Clostridia bacterium]|nr:carbon-nitrogen hydrolase family protein [Clostridia bacterium]
MKDFMLALCQMRVSDDKAANLKKAESLVREASLNGARMVVLPEMFICPYQNDAFVKNAETLSESPSLKKLSQMAQNNGVYLFAGSIPEKQGDRVYNTCLVFDDNGEHIGTHRKMHLFDIDVPGQMVFKESDTLSAGDSMTMVETPFAKVGVMICYDIRFPELARLMALNGAEVLIVPAAFNMVTGPAHWELLIRTRALDNQAYLAACAPARCEEASYIAYAHSMISDPWGRIIAEGDINEEIVYAT